MYRCIALKCLRSQIQPSDSDGIEKLLNSTVFTLEGKNGTDMYMDGKKEDY